MPRLIILSKDRSAKQVYISGRMTTIGRNPTNSLVVDRDRVSRKHAVIDWDGEQYTIIDIGSRNGTFVNGLRISQRLLRNGDTITVGDCDLRFLCDAETPSEKALRLITMPGALADLARQQPALA
ncbi:FHA domain-containing protein [Variovorax soli]|uniref:FHA domain-containing protein n=1 Tax=Variovorax soli TaxID=376815 RepID=UPI0008395A32|nr:FHA domain-containing protein [Variovorax soli]